MRHARGKDMEKLDPLEIQKLCKLTWCDVLFFNTCARHFPWRGLQVHLQAQISSSYAMAWWGGAVCFFDKKAWITSLWITCHAYNLAWFPLHYQCVNSRLSLPQSSPWLVWIEGKARKMAHFPCKESPSEIMCSHHLSSFWVYPAEA